MQQKSTVSNILRLHRTGENKTVQHVTCSLVFTLFEGLLSTTISDCSGIAQSIKEKGWCKLTKGTAESVTTVRTEA
jgi:hypothetical protein